MGSPEFSVTMDLCASVDGDGDGVCDGLDNCPSTYNPDQVDTDTDGEGDACDLDDDGDGVYDFLDNCPLIANPNQIDTDNDGPGDACDDDDDGDGILDGDDNCPLTYNPLQEDSNGNGVGDACENDHDVDGVLDYLDNCPFTYNPDQADNDGDGDGDACDDDDDNDGIDDVVDNCRTIQNVDQLDSNCNGIGDACDGSYTVIDIGVQISAESSFANDINDDGIVVGRYGDYPDARAYTWQNGVWQDLGALDGDSRSEALAINNQNVIVGRSSTSSSEHAVRWVGGQIEPLGSLGGAGADSVAYDVNELNQVVGWSEISPGGEKRGFLWEADANMISLSPLYEAVSINDSTQILGGIDFTVFEQHAAIWHNGAYVDLGTLTSGTDTHGREINNAGQAVGYGDGAWLWTGSVLEELPNAPLGMPAYGQAISSGGQVMGYAGGKTVRWDEMVMTNISDTLPPTVASVHLWPNGANDLGQFVGFAFIDGKARAMLATPVDPCGCGVEGDLDGDNQVGLADLQILLANYGATSGATYEDGDLDGDEDIDLDDLQLLLAEYGLGCA